jgi:hypothetical protein
MGWRGIHIRRAVFQVPKGRTKLGVVNFNSLEANHARKTLDPCAFNH